MGIRLQSIRRGAGAAPAATDQTDTEGFGPVRREN
jgi:hypothetical protein